MEKFKISVVSACYNSSNFLDDFFKSIKNQSFKNFEVILIDDGSTDDTLKKINEFKIEFPNVTVLHENNQGHTVARNNAIKHVKGEFLYICDPDDAFHPDTLNILYRLIKENNADVSILSYKNYPENFKYDDIKHKSFTNKKTVVFNGRDQITSQYLSGNKFEYAPWNKLYKMELIKKIPSYPKVFDENIKFIEDVDFNTKYFSLCNKAVFSHLKIYYYRVRKKSISHKFSENVFTTLDAHKSFDLLDKKIFKESQLYIKIKICIDNFYTLYLLKNSDYQNSKKIKDIYEAYKSNLKYCIKGKRLHWYVRYLMWLGKPYIYFSIRNKLNTI